MGALICLPPCPIQRLLVSSVYIICSVYGHNLRPLFHASKEVGQAWVDKGNDELSTFSKERARLCSELWKTREKVTANLSTLYHAWNARVAELPPPTYKEVKEYAKNLDLDGFRGYKLVELQELKTDGL